LAASSYSLFKAASRSSEKVGIRATRLVSNAKGYGPWRVGETWDNPNFDINFVIEI
jgi:hypothetical protein